MIDERTRHEMYLGLEENLGPDVADTLMKLLPPVGWADVATQHDLSALEERIELRFQLVGGRFDRVDARFDAINVRFDGIDARFDGLEERMDLRMQAHINRLLYFLIPTCFSSIVTSFAIAKFA